MTSIENDIVSDAVSKWWYAIQHDSGGLAKLKHQSDILGIEGVGCFYDLVKMLPNIDVDTLASIAMVVCHVESNVKTTTAKAMGKKTGQSDHVVSEIRFNKLISMDLEDAARELVRMLPLIDNATNIEKLAKDLRYWNSETLFSKKQWLNDYYSS